MVCNIIEVGGVINNNFIRNKYCLKSELNERIEQFTGDKYMTIYSYDSKDINTCNFIAPLYLDFDIDNLKDNYDKLIRDLKIIVYRLKTELHLENRDIEIYFSGAKGFHILINHKVFGFKPSRTINKDLKAVAIYFKASTFTKCIDTSIYDYRRLFRIPNTINSKTGLYKVPISYSKLIKMNYSELLSYASKPRKMIKKPVIYNQKAHDAFYELINKIQERKKQTVNTAVAREYVNNKKLLPCVEYLLQNGAEEGQRNNCTIALASALFQIGHSKEEVIEILDTWNQTKNDSPISDRELYTTINSAYNNSKNNIYYGCSAFRELGVCIKYCPINK